jgi:hypothetical protein
LKNGSENMSAAIGRAKTVILTSGPTGEPVGIVSEIVTHVTSKPLSDRLVFRGPAHFDSRSLKQLYSTILPLVDQIAGNLGIPPRDYEISVTNIGAAAAADRGLKISGFSADLPVFLALLSTSLHIDVRTDIIGTGHIASLDGEIVPVKGIQAKLAAALETPGVTGFVLPDLEEDRSLRVLTPVEHESVKACLLRHKGAINIHPVANVSDALRVFFKDESIVLGSLQSGFFSVHPSAPDQPGLLHKSVELLRDGNDKRFWDCLSRFLLNRHLNEAKQFLRALVRFYIDRQIYPENFGQRLLQLVFSLPPRLREEKEVFPLFPIDLYLKVSQAAKAKDLEDTQKLYKATFWERQGLKASHVSGAPEPQDLADDSEQALFKKILAEINKDSLSGKYGRAFDIGRSTYITENVTVNDGSEFNALISSFYAHMMRHTTRPTGASNESAIAADAIDLVNKAFESRGGYKAALSEAKNGTNGGMRLIFDTMTDYLKHQEMDKQVSRIFKELVDPLDWEIQVKLMEVFMQHIGPHVRKGIGQIPAKQLASKWDLIIRLYVESMDKVQNLIKSL